MAVVKAPITVWLRSDAFTPWNGTRDEHPVGEGDIVRFFVDAPALDDGEQSSDLGEYPVSASPEQIARWQKAERDFRLAQDEMRALLAVQVAAEAQADAERRAAEQAEWQRQRLIEDEARREAEVALDHRDGPREWHAREVFVARARGFRIITNPTGFTIHHVACHHIRDLDVPRERCLRLPQALDRALDAGPGGAGLPTRVCKRCGGPLLAMVETMRGLAPVG